MEMGGCGKDVAKESYENDWFANSVWEDCQLGYMDILCTFFLFKKSDMIQPNNQSYSTYYPGLKHGPGSNGCLGNGRQVMLLLNFMERGSETARKENKRSVICRIDL